MNQDKKQQMVAAKRRELEEKKTRWMQERKNEDLYASSYSSLSTPVRSQSSHSSSRTSSDNDVTSSSRESSQRQSRSHLSQVSQEQSNNSRVSKGDDMLHMTKSELAEHIREEISRELRNQQGQRQYQQNLSSEQNRGGSSSIGSTAASNYRPLIRETTMVDTAAQHRNLEQYVMQTEANSHTCKICFELMVSPQRTPMFLYPCGHTFCKECMGRHTHQAQINTQAHQAHPAQTYIQQQHGTDASIQKPRCPFCRTVIQSMVTNQAIKELIDGYTEQKEHLLPPIHRRSEQEAVDQVYEQYNAVVSSCEIRLGVIDQEILERRSEVEAQQVRKRKLQEAEAHLQRERSMVTEKIRELQEELSLLDSHLEAQLTKHQEVDGQLQVANAALSVLERTRGDLEQQIEKATLLRSHAAQQQQQQQS